MADSKDDLGPTTNRRVLFGGVGAAGLLGLTGALAACGSDDTKSSTGTGQPSPSTAISIDGNGGDSGDGGDALTTTSDIPVGGGKIFSNDNVVVTQPVAGTYKAFSATCTHQACLVQSISNGVINCPCHGSQYSIKDGSVVTAARGTNKKNQQPLPEKTVTVSGDQISVG